MVSFLTLSRRFKLAPLLRLALGALLTAVVLISIYDGLDDAYRWASRQKWVRGELRKGDQMPFLHTTLILDRLLDAHCSADTRFVVPALYARESDSHGKGRRYGPDRQYKRALGIKRFKWFLLTAAMYGRAIEPLAYRYRLSLRRFRRLRRSAAIELRALRGYRVYFVPGDRGDCGARMAVFLRGKNILLAPLSRTGEAQ